ncbi:MAG: ABC-type transport system involved in cytochrome c biosis, permease component [Bacteroidota bacterium]|nr:ABC-type transport system involved in cytochrome c biosis, permease component [Bacteroidota bacterium]
MKNWWKYVCVILLLYTIVMGFAGPIPPLNILEQSIRNLYFHVPMWFSMMALMLASTIFSIRYLSRQKIEDDIKASACAQVGFVFGILGIITGSLWARVTWGAWWVFQEIKLNGAAAALLVYAAYFILRGSFDDEEKKARFSAVYSIFAFVMFMVLINVIPRISNSSLHPGNGGNPGFNSYDLDSNLRMVFYPAVMGWILLSAWITSLIIRMQKIFRKIHQLDIE